MQYYNSIKIVRRSQARYPICNLLNIYAAIGKMSTFWTPLTGHLAMRLLAPHFPSLSSPLSSRYPCPFHLSLFNSYLALNLGSAMSAGTMKQVLGQ
jgi:hypothetical protein